MRESLVKVWIIPPIWFPNLVELNITSLIVSGMLFLKGITFLEFFKTTAIIPGPYIYHIGLSWDVPSQQWMWEQPVNQPKIPVFIFNYHF